MTRKIKDSSYCAAHHLKTHQKSIPPEPRQDRAPVDFRRQG